MPSPATSFQRYPNTAGWKSLHETPLSVIKTTQLGDKQLGSELGVAYLVEGSVRRSGNRIRVTAELVDAQTGIQIWTDRYDRQFEDVFAVQDEITAMLGARLEPEIGTAERMKVVVTKQRDLGAWEKPPPGSLALFPIHR